MVLRDSKDEDCEAAEEDEEGSNAGWPNWEYRPEDCRVINSVSSLAQGKCNTECEIRLTRVPAGEDDSLDEGDGQQDGGGACEAPVQRRLEKVLIRSPPDWSHLCC